MGDINSKVTSGLQIKQAFHLAQFKTQGLKHVPICWAGRGKDNSRGLEINGCHQASQKAMSSGEPMGFSTPCQQASWDFGPVIKSRGLNCKMK